MKKTARLIACSTTMCLGFLTSNLTAQTVNMTQGSMNVVSGSTDVACNDGTFTLENSYIRSFKISDYVNCTTFHVDSVRFGVEEAMSVNGSQLLDINLYALPAGATLSYSNLTQIGVFNGSLTDVSQEVENVPFSTDISGTSSLVVEIASPDGTNDHIFIMGSNMSAQSKPSFWSAPICGTTDITNINTQSLNDLSLVIGVYGHPTILKPDTFTTGKSNVCAGDVVTYTVPSVTGTTYNWSYSGTGVTLTNTNNSTSLSFSATATSGVLSVTATNGAITSEPRTLSITVNPTPAPTVSRAGNVLTSSIATNCTWYRNNIAITGANSSTYTMTQNGDYFVKVSQSGCSGNSDTVHITDIGNNTAVNDVDLKNIALVISPNPTTDILNIQCNIPVNATVFSVDGKKVLSATNAKTIDMRSVNKGIYYVLFTTKEGIQVKREKIIKL